MTVTIDLTETMIFAALRSVLATMLPAGIEIDRAQVNRVAEPIGPNFVMMTPTTRTRLATNIDTFIDNYPNAPGVASAMQATQMGVQLDVHGPASADNAQMISTLMRDDFAYQAFLATGLAIAPLYADDPKQTPFTNAEEQYEYRWTVDVMLQVNPIVSSVQDFATSVVVDVINVDATYPL